MLNGEQTSRNLLSARASALVVADSMCRRQQHSAFVPCVLPVASAQLTLASKRLFIVAHLGQHHLNCYRLIPFAKVESLMDPQSQLSVELRKDNSPLSELTLLLSLNDLELSYTKEGLRDGVGAD